MPRSRPRRGRDTGPSWALGADLGQDWYPLPLDEDPAAFATHVVAVLVEEAPTVLGRPLPQERAEAIAAEFQAMTEHAQRTSAFAASLFRPLYDGPTLALTEAHVFPAVTGGTLAEWVSAEHASEPGPDPVLTEVVLPVGPAVRVHAVTGPQAEQSPVVESVSHYFTAPGDDVVRTTTSWTTPDAEGDLVALADDVARGLAFR